MNAPSNDWFWHVAADQGEALLRQIEQGSHPPCDSKALLHRETGGAV